MTYFNKSYEDTVAGAGFSEKSVGGVCTCVGGGVGVAVTCLGTVAGTETGVCGAEVIGFCWGLGAATCGGLLGDVGFGECTEEEGCGECEGRKFSSSQAAGE